jgi:hypothetical protein
MNHDFYIKNSFSKVVIFKRKYKRKVRFEPLYSYKSWLNRVNNVLNADFSNLIYICMHIHIVEKYKTLNLAECPLVITKYL